MFLIAILAPKLVFNKSLEEKQKMKKNLNDVRVAARKRMQCIVRFGWDSDFASENWTYLMLLSKTAQTSTKLHNQNKASIQQQTTQTNDYS